jgi:hypothetical protein
MGIYLMIVIPETSAKLDIYAFVIQLTKRPSSHSLRSSDKIEHTFDIRHDSLEKILDNIAVSFLPDFESLSKNALEKGLNYFTQGYIHNIKISEARGAMRVDARCWRSNR